MSSNFDQNIRPEPDDLIVKIADYVNSYEMNSDLALDTARYCLMDTLGCGFLALMYTKELIFNEFKEVTKKDQKKKKEIFTNRIEYLKCLKEDMIKVPRNFNNISITPQQLQNTIDCWSAPNPRDAFYKSVFGMTYAEKKQQEELEYFFYENGEKKEVRKSKQETQPIH